MPTFVNTPRGTVVSIWGKAYIRGTDGVWRPLKLGEVVKPGDAVLTEQDSIVQMSDAKGQPLVLGPAADPVQSAIAALEQGDREAAPAAGLAGGDGGDLQPGLRVERVVESVTASAGVERLDAASLTPGVATQSNPQGTDAPAAPSIGVDAPTLTNDNTPAIAGTSNLPVGASVTLTVTDANGAVQTFSATVQADGSYAADVPAPLADGAYSVVAEATVPGAGSVSARDGGQVDTGAPSLAVDAPALTNDSTPTLTGSTDLPAGSSVTLVVTGADGVVLRFDAVVQADGSFSAAVPSPLAEGGYSVVAVGTDAAGNTASASDTGVIDITPPAASITLDPIAADDIVNVGEAAGSIRITGSVGGDVQVGDRVTLTVNGSTYSGAVQAGRTFAIDVAGADVLADADRRIDASVTTTDAAGNTGSASNGRDYAVNTAPLAVDDTSGVGEDAASVAGDLTPGSTGQDSDADGDTFGVTGVAAGAVGSASGHVGTAVAGSWGTLTVAADGHYTYVPAPLAQSLDAGETVTDTFTYTIDDGRGGSASATLTISVVGTDDPTTFSGSFSGAVQEDVSATAAGSLAANDPDVGARGFVAQSASGSYGGFTIDAAGHWSYTLANSAAHVQALAAGQSVTETFLVSADDGSSASITVTVSGSNDAPVVSSTAVHAVEQGAPVALGLAVPTDVDAGAVLTITVTGLPSIGEVQLADGTPVAGGAVLSAAQLAGLRYLPPADHDGVAPVGGFTYRVSDGSATVDGGTVITLATVNDAPTAVDASASTSESTVLDSTVPAATDIDGSVTGYALVTGVGAGNGSLTFHSDGSYRFEPGSDFDSLAAGSSRQVTFTYSAIDDQGATSAPATVTITVTGNNNGPVAVDDGSAGVPVLTVAEDSGASAPIAVLANDSDADGDALTVVVASSPHGTVTVNPDQTLSFTPAANFHGATTISYTVSDGQGGSSSATVFVNVTPVNDAPVAVDDHYVIDEDSSLAIPLPLGALAANDSDVDGDSVSVYMAASPVNGTFDIIGGNLVFTPNPNFHGQASFVYGVHDGHGATSTATVHITVNPVVDLPVAADDTATTDEDTPLTLAAASLLGNDATGDGGALAITSVQGAVNGTVALVGGNVVFTPDANYHGPASFSYTATDADGVSTTATVDVTVNAVNDAPMAQDDFLVTDEDTPLVIALPLASLAANDTDVDGDALSVYMVAAANHGTLDVVGGNLVFTPDPDFHGQASFTYGVHDGHGGVDTATVHVTVNPVNDAPVAGDAGAGTDENTVLSASVPAAADVDGSIAAYTLVSDVGAGNGSLSFQADGSYIFNPGSDFDDLVAGATRQVSFSYSAVDDGGGVSAPATVTITVTGTNDAPVAYAAGVGTDENLVLHASVPAATDVDGTIAGYALVSGLGAGNGSLSFSSNGSYSFDPGSDFDSLPAGASRQVSFTYHAIDDAGAASAPATVTITVLGTNDGPLALNDGSAGVPVLTVAEDSGASAPIAVLANDSDADGDALTVIAASSPHGTVTVNPDQTLSFTPAANFHGATTISYTVSDGQGGSSSATVFVNVTPVNDAPAAVDDAFVTDEDTPLMVPASALTANDSDAEGQALTVIAVFDAVNGSAALVGGNMVFTPAPDYHGPASFAYLVTDGFGGVSAATVNVTVGAVNDAPVAQASAVAVAEDASVISGAVVATDVDAGAVLSYALDGAAPDGLVFNADGSYSFDPSHAAYQSLGVGQSQLLTVPYTVTDEAGASSSASLVITVTGTNDAPVASTAAFTVAEDAAVVNGSVVAADIDANAALSFALTGPAPAGLVFNADGSYSFDPSHAAYQSLGVGQSTVLTVPYRATDDQGAVSVANLVITVTGTNDGPVAVNDGTAPSPVLTVAEDSGPSAPIAVLANDSDADGDALTVVAASSPNGTVTVNPDNTLSFTPAANFHGATTISYTASDGQGGTASATVFVQVTPVNDAPTAADTSVSTAEDTVLAASLPVATDVDGQPVTYGLAAPAAHGVVVVNADGSYTYTPDADYAGSDSFSYSVSDGQGGSNTYVVDVTVNPLNDAPVIGSNGGGSVAAVSVAENTTAVTTVTATDVDAGQTLGYSIVGGADAARFTIDATTGALSFVSAPDFEAPTDADGDNSYVVQVRVADGQGGSDTQTLTVSVTNVDETPVSAADSAARVEGSNGTGFLNVLANDSDPDGSALAVTQVATSAGATAVTVNGVTSITTAQGGSVVMNSDGSFRYIAPTLSHDASNTPVADSFAYRASDGVNAGAWTTVTLNVSDSAPTGVADSASVAFNGSVSGNLLANDLGADGPLQVTQFTHGATTVSVPAGGSASIDTAGGLLTVGADGSYTYASQLPSLKVLTGSSLATWEQSTNLYGFTSGSALSGGNLNLSSLTPSRAAQSVFVTGSKNGIGVGTSGSGTVGNGETLVMDMLETTTHVTIGIAQLNTNQNPANALWAAYAADGTLVASGNFVGATPVSSGTEYTLEIDNAQPFQYITLQWANNSQGFVLSSLELTRNPSNYAESFGYTVVDADGDSATGTFNVTPAASSSGSAVTTGTAGSDALAGSDAANTIDGLAGDDVLRGFGGADTVDGGEGVDALDGGSGDDALVGGAGNDLLRGGAGSDSLTGGAGADTFEWRLADRGSAGSPAIDTVADFDSATLDAGGDILDLRDLLQGEATSATLDRYLDFSVSGGNTTIRISSTGGFTDGTYASGSEDQRIVLSGVDIRATLGLSGAATDAQIISELINRGKLLTDVPAGG